jgi:hypothetical protein
LEGCFKALTGDLFDDTQGCETEHSKSSPDVARTILVDDLGLETMRGDGPDILPSGNMARKSQGYRRTAAEMIGVEPSRDCLAVRAAAARNLEKQEGLAVARNTSHRKERDRLFDVIDLGAY